MQRLRLCWDVKEFVKPIEAAATKCGCGMRNARLVGEQLVQQAHAQLLNLVEQQLLHRLVRRE
eukprot:6175730-Pleurochrysis_carterae.AAC.4